ncbi:MAG: radical SAM protein [Clostridia bacterium]|nr:radical SAM protein [Clostridia bacterium]
MVGFSCYMWNMEYNKVLARKIKSRFPSCTVLFGGPQIPDDTSVLEACPFVDVLIHGEGEVPFLRLLRALRDGAPLDGVNCVSFRGAEGPVTTPLVTAKEFDFPSPFQSGFYDRLLREHPEIEFVPVIETSRGCPNRCAYCSWATSTARVRLFPLERVYADLEWVAAHRMEFLGLADANFGMFPRDEEIVDYVIDLLARTGYPKKLQTSYAKDSFERVFRITEKLNRVGLCKAVTLSFQTMSEEAQSNIGRANISLDFYRTLLKRYIEAGIPTYTELILGMPGETRQSFFDGVEELLEKGQHISLLVHLCEWLPLSGMGKKEYLEKYKIHYTTIPLNQPHAQISDTDEVPEYSHIVTSTCSMSEEEWKQCALFSACVSCFHHLGLLQLPALYLYFEHGVRYVDFYSALLDFLLEDPEGVFCQLRRQFDGIVKGQAGAVMSDPRFGDVTWTFEEYAFLRTVYDKDAFYASMDSFLSRYLPDEALRRELLAYQAFVIKSADGQKRRFSGNHLWKPYFASLILNEPCLLEKKPVIYTVEEPYICADWAAYARELVWYGRRGGKYLYATEIREAEPHD